MTSIKRKYFDEVKGNTFNFLESLEAVAKRELEIFSLAGLHFAKMSLKFQSQCREFFKKDSLNVLLAFHYPSLPSFVKATFRTYALSDGILYNVKGEYGERVASSVMELKLTEFLRNEMPTQWITNWSNSAGQQKFWKPGDVKSFCTADAYDPVTKTCLFVNGCYWHAHPSCKTGINADLAKYGHFVRQMEDLAKYCSSEVKTIEIIWECQVKAALEICKPSSPLWPLKNEQSCKETDDTPGISIIQAFREPLSRKSIGKIAEFISFTKSPVFRPLRKMVIRSAFRSALCETYCLKYMKRPSDTNRCEIIDMSSLYPYCAINFPLPCKKYFTLLGDEIRQEDFAYGEGHVPGQEPSSPMQDLMYYQGMPVMAIVHCRVFPPTDLLHPFLHVEIDGLTIGTLCRKCAILREQGSKCEHSLRDRSFDACYTSTDLAYGKSLGYSYHIFELIVYPESSYFVREFLTLLAFEKLRHCEFPPQVKTAEEKDTYCADLNIRMRFKEIIKKELVSQDINPNKEQREFVKACLNHFLGTFSPNTEKYTRVDFVTCFNQLFEHMRAARVDALEPLSESVLQVTLKNEEIRYQEKNSNVTTSCFVTAFGRVVIHKKMMELVRMDALLLRVSTDSIYFVMDNKKNLPWPISEAFGCWKRMFHKVLGVAQMGTRTLCVMYENEQGEIKEHNITSGISVYNENQLSYKDFQECTDKMIRDKVVDFSDYTIDQLRTSSSLRSPEIKQIRRPQTIFSANLFNRRQILCETQNYETVPYGFK